MIFKKASTYSIDYGITYKLATFLFKKDEVNIFRDRDGEFGLSDSFIDKGTITVKEMENDF